MNCGHSALVPCHHIQSSSPMPFSVAPGKGASQVSTWTVPDAPEVSSFELQKSALVAYSLERGSVSSGEVT